MTTDKLITSRRVGRFQAVAAFAVAATILALAALILPFGQVKLAAHPGFMPAFGAMTLVTDALTACLLIAQARLTGRNRLVRLGAAYLFSALAIVPHLLAFPGVVTAEPLLGGDGSAVWLWCLWHGGFAICVIRFALQPGGPRQRDVANLLARVAVVAIALSVVATACLPWLPAILTSGDYNRINTTGIGPAILGMTLTALVLVMTRLRGRDTVSLWLAVGLLAASLDVALTLFAGGRFTVGWYGARVLSLLTGMTVLFAMVAELMAEAGRVAEVNERLEFLLRTDVLTGLANRRAFEAALSAEWRRAHREQNPVSLLMIDIDFFKGFNDRHGHPAGDACLRTVARALGNEVQRPADIAARIGGEEFGILLPMTDEAGAWQVAERVRAAVADLLVPHVASELGFVTVSIGVATARPFASSATIAALVGTADRALYQAKAAGRNTIRGYHPPFLALIAATPPVWGCATPA